MNLLKKLFTILFLLATISAFSQTIRFNRTYDFGSTTDPVFDHLNNLNNGIIVNGRICTVNQKILICKINESGDITDTLVQGEDTGMYSARNFIIVSENKILSLNFHESLPSYTVRQYTLLIDTNLNIIEDSVYSMTNVNFWGSAQIHNSFYFTGFTFFDNNEDSLTGGTNTLLWKTDTNFNKIISKSIGDPNYPDDCSVIQSGFDNNLLLGGLTLAHAPGSVLGTNRIDWYLVNSDTSGNILGEYYYGNPTYVDFYGIKGISPTIDSTYFLVGLKAAYQDTQNFFIYSYKHIVKIDRNFQTIWEKDYGIPRTGQSVEKVIRNYDSNQTILGQHGYLDCSNQSIYSFLLKFDNSGNVLWSRNYYKGDTCNYIRYRAWDLIETKDSGFAFCGSAIDTANAGPNQSTWLVKTDSLGCDGYQSCNDTALLIQPFQIPDTLCLNDTNWVKIEINGRSAPYKLTLSNGQEFDSIYYPNTAPPHIFYDMPVYPTLVDSNWQLIITLTDPWGADITDTLYFVVHDCGTVIANDYYVENKIKIYPNPAEDIVNVQIRGRLDNDINISLYNSDGSLCKTLKADSDINKIDIANLPAGLYFIKVQGSGFTKTEKIVLE